MRKFVLDTQCFIEATRRADAAAQMEEFAAAAAPGLYLSAVVAAELRAGARPVSTRKRLESSVLEPYIRRGRVLTPSAMSWAALGEALAVLREREGLEPKAVSRSFAFDVLIAYSCREAGATLVTRNVRDMERIRRVFAFEFTEPYPMLS